MPKRKRKKKEEAQVLPPLQFLESPIDLSPKGRSPEYGALNPLTVKAVPIEDIHDLSWVTPQFDKGLRCLRRGVNETNRRKTQSRRKIEINGLDQNAYDISSKYRPLAFVQADTNNSDRPLQLKVLLGQKGVGGSPHPCQDSDFTSTEKDPGEQQLVGDVDQCPAGERLKSSTDKNCGRSLLPGRVSFPNPLQSRRCHDEDNSSSSTINDAVSTNAKHKQCEFGDSNSNPHNVEDSDKKVCHEKRLISIGKLFPLLVERLCTPPVAQVLAVDTPECEYGLTMRQRQLK